MWPEKNSNSTLDYISHPSSGMTKHQLFLIAPSLPHSLALSLLVPDTYSYPDKWAVKATVNGNGSPYLGLYSTKLFNLTPPNVDMVLEDV